MLRRQLYFILSGVCLLIGVTTTHGLGGQLRHAIPTEAGDEITRTWRFFQPFQYVPVHLPYASHMWPTPAICFTVQCALRFL